MSLGRLACATVLGLVAPLTFSAHLVTVEDVLEQLNGKDASKDGVERALRDPNLPRHLVIRVAPGWHDLPAKRRLALAESWWKLWRHTGLKNAIVSVLDDQSGQAVVNFEPGGRPALVDPPSRLHPN